MRARASDKKERERKKRVERRDNSETHTYRLKRGSQRMERNCKLMPSSSEAMFCVYSGKDYEDTGVYRVYVRVYIKRTEDEEG